MTPEELRAQKVYITCVESGCINLRLQEYKMKVIREAIREAVAEERESCAKIADSHISGEPPSSLAKYDEGYDEAAVEIANEIRARTSVESAPVCVKGEK